MFVRCFCELNVCLDEYELFARPRVAGHYIVRSYWYSSLELYGRVVHQSNQACLISYVLGYGQQQDEEIDE